MASFNPDIGGVPYASSLIPDQTGSSRGASGNRAFESLFEAAGTAVKGVSDFITTSTEDAITKDARKGYDAANAPYDPSADPSDIPSELKNGQNSMKALQTAFDQGKVSDTYYYGQLAQMSKSLRAKYPGYDNFVDQTVQNVTGVKPANAYRNAIMNEIGKAQSQAQAAGNKQLTWENENDKYIAQIFPDYFQNKDKYDFSTVQNKVANLKAQNASIDAQSARIDFLNKNKSLNQGDAEQGAVSKATQVANTFVQGVGNGLGFDQNNVFKHIENMQKNGYSPQEYTQLVQQLNTAGTALQLQIHKSLTDPLTGTSSDSYSSVISDPVKIKNIEDTAMTQFNAIKQMVTDKNFGLAAYYTNLNSVTAEADKANILSANPDLRVANALNSMSPTLAQNYIESSGKWDGIVAQLVPEITANISAGKDTFNDALTRVVNSNSTDKDKSAGANALIDSNVSTITSGNADPQQMSNAVSSLYGLDQKGHDVFSLVQPGEYKQLYTRLYNADTTKAIIATKDPKAIQTYFAGAMDRVNAIPEFRQAAATLSDVKSQFPSGDLKVDYNADFHKLVLTSPGAGNSLSGLKAIAFKGQIASAKSAVDSLNTVFGTIGPILDGMGMSQDKQGPVYQQVLKDLNVNLEQGAKGGFFDWLGSQLSSAFSQIDEANGDVKRDQGMAQALDFKLPEQTVPSGYYDSLRQSESNGDDNAQNPNSSASGRYQFTDQTWTDLVHSHPGAGLTVEGKNDPNQQEIGIKLSTRDNADYLSRHGVATTAGNLYAAHFLGTSGAALVLREPDDADVADYLPRRVLTANPNLQGMTVGDFKKWTTTQAS